MASMLLGWTLADVMNALELDGYEDLGTLQGVTEHRLKLNSIHTELEHHLSPYPGLECWLSHRQDSSIDLRDPVVIGVPTMFGGEVPEVLWYLAPNAHINDPEESGAVSSLSRFMTDHDLIPPTVHLSGWHCESSLLAKHLI